MDRFIAILAILLVITPSLSYAQDQEVQRGFESWISVQATKRFDFDLDISLEQQVRFLEYQGTFTEIGLNYKALDFINVGTEMRFQFPKNTSAEYRLAGYFGLEAEKKNFELEYRFKVTSKFSSEDDTKLVLRNKLSAKYTIKKDWRLNTTFEVFLPREDNRFWLRKYRWLLGLRYKITKMHLITLFYGIERTGDLDLDDPVVFQHIFGTRYDIRW